MSEENIKADIERLIETYDLKRADAWLIAHFENKFEGLIDYILSFTYGYESDKPLWKKAWDIFMLIVFLSPFALFEWLLWANFGMNSIYFQGFVLICFFCIFWFTYFLWKILDITIGQTIIGTALVIWFSYLLTN